MARAHANVQIGIWDDPDFRALSPGAQLLYLQLLSSSTLTYAGVADWRPRRIAMLSNGRTADEVEAAMVELEVGLFVIVDDESEEAFIRSFFKWDGLLQKPNVAKAMVREWGNVHSLELRKVIVHELAKLRGRFPKWRAFEAGVVDELLENESLNPSEMVRGRVPERVPERVPGTDAGRDAPLPTTYYLLPTTDNQQPATSNPQPSEVADATRPEIDHLLDLLDGLIQGNGSKRPARNKTNTDAARLLIDKDGYTVEQVEFIIRWSQQDEFWRSNILSMSKLRTKFDQLKLRAQAPNGNRAQSAYSLSEQIAWEQSQQTEIGEISA